MKSRRICSPEPARLVWTRIREVSADKLVRCKVIVLGKQQTGCGKERQEEGTARLRSLLGRIMGWRWEAERHMSERIERTSHESTMVPSGFEERWGKFTTYRALLFAAGQHLKSFTSKTDFSQYVS